MSTDAWAFQPHPEVWLLVASVVALYAYAVRRIGPRAVRGDERVVTGRQVAWFSAGVAVLWVASDWPLHDIAEEHLYSMHMVQHLLLSFVLVPLLYLGTPTWLARLVVGSGAGYRFVRRITRALPAIAIFNGVVVISHIPAVVNGSVGNGLLHYAVHTLVVLSALVMWLPVCGPLPELRYALPLQMPYLFVHSIIPTIPAGWLTFADGAVYEAYDNAFRLWGVSVADDQQMAGMIMKVFGGLYLWSIITALFFRFAAHHAGDDRYTGAELDRRAPVPRPGPAVAAAAAPAAPAAAPDEVRVPDDTLTWEQVAADFERLGPPPPDPH
jgi:putative membrane protein